MGMKFQKVGDWEEAIEKLKKLKEGIVSGMEKVFEEIGKEGEKRLKEHIENQDLPWKPLNPDYIAQKESAGESTDILVRSRKMYDSITFESSAGGVWIGIPEGEQTDQGDEMSMIAAIHEFGAYSVGIDERPLYGPTQEELKEWLKSSNIVQDIMRDELDL